MKGQKLGQGAGLIYWVLELLSVMHTSLSSHVISWVLHGCLVALPCASSVMEPAGSFGNKILCASADCSILSRGFLIGAGGPEGIAKLKQAEEPQAGIWIQI